MVGEEVASSQQLRRKVDVTTVLEESIIVKLSSEHARLSIGQDLFLLFHCPWKI